MLPPQDTFLPESASKRFKVPPTLGRPEQMRQSEGVNANVLLLDAFGKEALVGFAIADEAEHIASSFIPGLDF